MTENVPENTGITREIFTNLIEGSDAELTSYVNTELGNKLTAMQKELMSNSAHNIENKPINRVSSSVKGTSQFVDTLHKQVNGIWGTEFDAYVRQNLKETEQIDFFTGLNDIIKSRLTSSNRPVLFDEIINANKHNDKIDEMEINKLRTLTTADFEAGGKFAEFSTIDKKYKTEMEGAILIEGIYFTNETYNSLNTLTSGEGKTMNKLIFSPQEEVKEGRIKKALLCIQPHKHGWLGASKGWLLKVDDKPQTRKTEGLEMARNLLGNEVLVYGNFDVGFFEGEKKYIIMDGSPGAKGGRKTRGKNKKNTKKGRSRRRR